MVSRAFDASEPGSFTLLLTGQAFLGRIRLHAQGTQDFVAL
jgi:hypothetical protein